MAERVGLLASGLRTASVTTPYIVNDEGAVAIHVVINITTLAGVNVVPHIWGYDETSNASYELLAGSVLTNTGTTVLKVGPDYTAGTNVAKDYLPYYWYLAVTVSGAGAGATFSAGASMI